jgi:hypothetical protein
MASQQLMWDVLESQYRGQASDGAVLTVEEPAMTEALKQAGKGVFEADWWRETMPVTLERWGITARRWTDEATGMPRVHYRLGTPTVPDLDDALRRTTGSLSERLISRKKEE